MPIYATPTQFNARYRSGITDQQLSEHYLPHASARLNAMLQPYFPIPLPSNNISATDLTIDLAYALILQHSKDFPGAEQLQKLISKRVEDLIAGKQAMVSADASNSTYSSPDMVWSDAPTITMQNTAD